MKITISKQPLALAVSRAQGAISDKNLSHMSLKALNEHCFLTITDRVLIIYSEMNCEVRQPGEVCFPAKIFSDIVRELPEGAIEIEKTEKFLFIRSHHHSEFSMKIPIIADKEWQEPPVLTTSNSAMISSDRLSYMIDQVNFCISHESPRNYGSVGYLHKVDERSLRLVGTDGYRLSYAELALDLPDCFLGQGVCLSKRALLELQRMCKEGFENIEVSVSEDGSSLLASVSGYRIFVRLSAVSFPNYLGVLPKSKMVPVEVSRPFIQSVTRRVMLAADKSKAVYMNFSDDALELQSRTLGSSESHESIPLENYVGGERKLTINGKFLSDVFATIGSDKVMLELCDENEPIVLLPAQEPNNCSSVHVLVPIKES